MHKYTHTHACTHTMLTHTHTHACTHTHTHTQHTVTEGHTKTTITEDKARTKEQNILAHILKKTAHDKMTCLEAITVLMQTRVEVGTSCVYISTNHHTTSPQSVAVLGNNTTVHTIPCCSNTKHYTNIQSTYSQQMKYI